MYLPPFFILLVAVYALTPIAIIGLIIALYRVNSRLKELEERLAQGNQPQPSAEPATRQSEVRPQPTLEPKTPEKIETSPPSHTSAVIPDDYLDQPPPVKTKTGDRQHSSEELTGRWIGRLGILALLIGATFFLHYAFENDWIGITGRVILGLVGGGVMIGIGHLLQARAKKYLAYSLILMGGGVALMFLSVYAALVFYQLIAFSSALFGLLAITALSVFLSLIYNARSLAVLGVVGAFLTPVLIGGIAAEPAILFFIYLLTVNLGVACLTFFRHWPILGQLAFLGTLTLVGLWWGIVYTSMYFGPFFVFLSIYFAIFLTVAYFNVLVTKRDANGSELSFLNMVVVVYGGSVLPLLAVELPGSEGFMAVFLALLYFTIGLALLQFSSRTEKLRTFSLGFGILFLTIAVPLQLSGPWIAVAWLLEALILAGVGLKLKTGAILAAAIAVYAVGLFMTLMEISLPPVDQYLPIINIEMLLLVFSIAVTYGLAQLFNLSRFWKTAGAWAGVMLVLANIITVGTLTLETDRWYSHRISEVQSRYQTDIDAARELDRPQEVQALQDQQQTRMESLRNQVRLTQNVIWGLYALALVLLGFAWNRKILRVLGVGLVLITAAKVFLDIWMLGELYRIAASIGFGILALIVSFFYAKYRDKINKKIF